MKERESGKERFNIGVPGRQRGMHGILGTSMDGGKCLLIQYRLVTTQGD